MFSVFFIMSNVCANKAGQWLGDLILSFGLGI